VLVLRVVWEEARAVSPHAWRRVGHVMGAVGGWLGATECAGHVEYIARSY
jgi:hypothetical protein